MVDNHPVFEMPPDNVRLWRYMDLGRFLNLLVTKSLYFSHRWETEDPWEGVHGFALGGRILTALPAQAGEEDISALYDLAIDRSVFNCWHENDRESVAMWSLYTSGREGVAIQTTVGRLKRVLENDPRTVIIARVQYVDYDWESRCSSETKANGMFDTLQPLLCKRRSFAHENEVRALIEFPLERIFQNSAGPTSIDVDLQTLIEKVVVAPTYPRWALGALRNLVERAGFAGPIEQSDLIRRPSAHEQRVTSP